MCLKKREKNIKRKIKKRYVDHLRESRFAKFAIDHDSEFYLLST